MSPLEASCLCCGTTVAGSRILVHSQGPVASSPHTNDAIYRPGEASSTGYMDVDENAGELEDDHLID